MDCFPPDSFHVVQMAPTRLWNGYVSWANQWVYIILLSPYHSRTVARMNIWPKLRLLNTLHLSRGFYRIHQESVYSFTAISKSYDVNLVAPLVLYFNALLNTLWKWNTEQSLKKKTLDRTIEQLIPTMAESIKLPRVFLITWANCFLLYLSSFELCYCDLHLTQYWQI